MVYPSKINNYHSVILFSLLLLFVSCNGTTSSNDNSEGEDPPVDEAKSVNISLPEAIFSDVSDIKEKRRSSVIANKIKDLIGAAPKESSVYISIYNFYDDKADILNSLRKAASRGVKVHIAIDSRDKNKDTISKLKGIKDIEVISVNNELGPNHNKFVLYTDILTSNGKQKNITLISSENWNASNQKYFNNAVVLKNKNLFEAYLDYWEEIKLHADRNVKNYEYKVFNNKKDGIRANFYPMRRDGNVVGPDPIVEILDGITNASSTTIKIAQSIWRPDRIEILNKLKILQNLGAKIQIIVPDNIVAKMKYELKDFSKRNGVYVKMFHSRGEDKIGMHSKITIIEGEWKGEKSTVLITGSSNYSEN